MDRKPSGELIFDRDEVAPLAKVLSQYLIAHLQLPEAEEAEITRLRQQTSDLIFADGFEDDPFEDFAAFIRKLYKREPVIDDVQRNQGYATTPNTDNAVGKAIIWASGNLAVGSPTVTGEVGRILETDYIESPMGDSWIDENGDGVPWNNEGLANLRGGAMLNAGNKAREWAAQLIDLN